QPHVTDFGLARRMEAVTSLSPSGAVVGTPSYMPPEQAAPTKGALTTAAHGYALGAILYELLTGRPPFRADTPLDTRLQVIEKERHRPRVLNPAVDRDLETICLKCLQKEPQRRYNSAEALAEDLERWLRAEPISARPVGRVERAWRWCRRRPAVASLLAARVGVIGGSRAGWTVLWLRADERRRQAEVARGEETKAKILAQESFEEARLNLYISN